MGTFFDGDSIVSEFEQKTGYIIFTNAVSARAALVPIVGFGSLGFLAVHYLLFGSSPRKRQTESQQVQSSNQPGED